MIHKTEPPKWLSRNNQSSSWQYCLTSLHNLVSCIDSWLLDHLISWYNSSSGFYSRSGCPLRVLIGWGLFPHMPTADLLNQCDQNPGPPFPWSNGIIIYCLLSFPCVFLSSLWILGLTLSAIPLQDERRVRAAVPNIFGRSAPCLSPSTSSTSNTTIFVPFICFT